MPRYSIDTLYSGLGVDSGYLYNKVGDTLFKDVGIGIVFNLNSLAAGDSTEFEFEYVFGENDSCEHFLGVDNKFYKSGDTIFACKDNIITAELYSTNTNKWNWNPSPNLNTIYEPLVLITVDSLDTYTAISIDSSKCTHAFDTFRIVVKGLNVPKPKLQNIGPNLWVDSIYNSYLWYRNFTPIPFSKSPRYFAKLPGYYFVGVIDSNGCSMRSDTIYIDSITANINEQNEKSDLKIFPNPCVDKIQISYEKPFLVNVYSTLGCLLIKQSKNNIIDLSAFPKALYFIEIVTDEGLVIDRRKILKTK